MPIKNIEYGKYRKNKSVSIFTRPTIDCGSFLGKSRNRLLISSKFLRCQAKILLIFASSFGKDEC